MGLHTHIFKKWFGVWVLKNLKIASLRNRNRGRKHHLGCWKVELDIFKICWHKNKTVFPVTQDTFQFIKSLICPRILCANDGQSVHMQEGIFFWVQFHRFFVKSLLKHSLHHILPPLSKKVLSFASFWKRAALFTLKILWFGPGARFKK